MWEEILPNAQWINSNVPQIIRENSVSLQSQEVPASEDLNMETLAQAHIYIIAGACMAVGFRFAGTANSDAFNCLMGHYNLETCLSIVLLSLSMVMAGSGNLKVLQLCRFMHKKTGGELNYGFHMAHHMALGLLFLGGGSRDVFNVTIASRAEQGKLQMQGTGSYRNPEAIKTFTSDAALVSFAECFCKPAKNLAHKQDVLSLFTSILYECVTQENPEILPTYMAIDQAVRRLERKEMSETFELWQIKLVLEFSSSKILQERLKQTPGEGLLMNSEFLPVMKCSSDNTLDQWLYAYGDVLKSYLTGQPYEEAHMNMLACFLVYHSIPTRGKIVGVCMEV
ncbi:Anaphase-promoting complex subunit 1 [Acipenser ruthenus]|uniref:Anaphase-promoting complex subunit 1 n=1 Tax=Acipenser ruthenus TaxID=7906 RepID=A0A662YS77_ACIRT|nr:Anaphase-promoting complex subunit 1 [Acipenser ruthenus]